MLQRWTKPPSCGQQAPAAAQISVHPTLSLIFYSDRTLREDNEFVWCRHLLQDAALAWAEPNSSILPNIALEEASTEILGVLLRAEGEGQRLENEKPQKLDTGVFSRVQQ